MAISRTFRLLSSSANAISGSGSGSGSSKTPVRWGILSAGRIASDYVKAMSVAEGAEAIAVAARSSSKASAFATAHSIPTFHGSYPELLSNPNVDVVYIGNTADHHFEWARESLLAGKPTVVEKPLALCYDDTKELIDLARQKNVFLMEGMWTRCFPAMRKLRQLIKQKEVGDVVYCQADFGWAFPTEYDSGDRIWFPNSGGVTFDIGMYIAQLGRVAFPGAKLKDVSARGTVKNGVDYSVMATVAYDRGENDNNNNNTMVGDGMLQMAITGAANTEERCVFQGTKGRIVIDGPFHVPQRLRVFHDEGRGSNEEVVYDYPLPEDPYPGEWNYPGSIGFVHQIEEVGRALREGRVECESYTWEDSLEVARILSEILYQVRGERDVVDEGAGAGSN
jgi:dihydrodiol dehydrogenase / D-xylose 1-dehydrogenase (NADP)